MSRHRLDAILVLLLSVLLVIAVDRVRLPPLLRAVLLMAVTVVGVIVAWRLWRSS